MSRLNPVLSHFENSKDIEVNKHSNIEIFNKPDIKDLSEENLLYFKKIMREIIESLTEHMLDRTFYFYDTREFSDRWVRVFEHVNLDIAVVVDIDYMFDDSKKVLSFPRNLFIYEIDSVKRLDIFEFGFDKSLKEFTDEDMFDFKCKIESGSFEMLNIIDKKVYAI